MAARFLLIGLLTLMLAACSAKPEPGMQAPFRGVKVGKPYKIDGEWYRPSYEPDYAEEGLASWYGPGFHGKSTANGERFDQYAMTAAHKTLPLPSIVRVENLENGREITVRVNDRGPFVDGRIIDLSKKAAEELGMRTKGVAKVRVSYLPLETAAYVQGRGGVPLEKQYAMKVPEKPVPMPRPVAVVPQNNLPELVADNTRVQAQSAPVYSVESRALPVSVVRKPPIAAEEVQVAALVPDVPLPQTAEVVEPPHAERTPVHRAKPDMPQAQRAVNAAAPQAIIQAASFSNPDNANRLAKKLAGLWRAEVLPIFVQGKTWYRVHIMPDYHDTRQVLDKLAALGLPDAKLIIR